MEKSRFDYVVFDIETTGLNPKSDRICEIGAIGVRGGLPQETFSTLVSIGGKMPARATEINGITDEMRDSRYLRHSRIFTRHRKRRALMRFLRGMLGR